MSLTVTDLFAGAGGSSTGMVSVPGVEVRMAANHWRLACDVHNANHPNTDHATVDLHQEDPRYFPRTDLLWASPECTKWSQANGGRKLPAIEEGLFEDPLSDEAATRSRLLMFDVLRFAEHHRYRAMVVENVVDIAMQNQYRLAWKAWRDELAKLGYEHRVVSLNSMHAQAFGAPAPQSRDRLYIVCWRTGERAPDVDRVMRPAAWCPRCEAVVESRQAFKSGRTVGRYRAQYVYVHDSCGAQVEPGWLPAAAAIDWSLRGTRIGDRAKPLAEKTRARIAAGIARYWRPFITEHRHEYRVRDIQRPLQTLAASGNHFGLLVPVEGRDGKEARPADMAMRTQTARAETGVAVPFIAELRGGSSDARSTTEPMATVTANGNHHALVTPYYGTAETAHPVSEPIGTLTTRDRYALVMRNNGSKGDGAEMTTPITETFRTLTTKGHQSLITPGDVEAAEAMVDDCEFRMLEPSEVAAGMAFPDTYLWEGTRRERVRMAGNAVTPPAARDLIAAVSEAITGEQVAA